MLLELPPQGAKWLSNKMATFCIVLFPTVQDTAVSFYLQIRRKRTAAVLSGYVQIKTIIITVTTKVPHFAYFSTKGQPRRRSNAQLICTEKKIEPKKRHKSTILISHPCPFPKETASAPVEDQHHCRHPRRH